MAWRPSTVNGDALSYHRIRSGLAMRDVGRLLGCGYRTIGRYEAGEHVPPFELVAKLAELYQCDVMDLFVPPPEQPEQLGKRSSEKIQAAAALEPVEPVSKPERPDREPRQTKARRSHPPSEYPKYDMTVLKHLRLERRLTQARLARLIGVSEMTIRRWEAGSRATWRSVLKVAEALGMKPEEIANPPAPPGAK